MTPYQLQQLLFTFSDALGIRLPVPAAIPEHTDYTLPVFLDKLKVAGETSGLLILENALPASELPNLISRADYPLAYFMQDAAGELYPVVVKLSPRTQRRSQEVIGKSVGDTPAQSDLEAHLALPGQVTIITAFPLNSISEDDKIEASEPLPPMKRLFRMLGTERKDIYTIYTYAVFIGAISLVLPLGIQAIIGLVQGGLVFSSIYVLIGLVIGTLVISGIMQVMQLTVVEHLRERLFAKAAFDFAYRIPRIKAEALFKFYPPELINRFFDIVIVQKSLPKVLIDITSAMIQILFGLILLAAYHPIFIAFSLVTVVLFVFIAWLFGKKTLDASIMKSKYKYIVANWLQAIARTLNAFKVAGNPSFPLQKMEGHVVGYLKYRKKYFDNLLAIYYSAVFFKSLVTGGLLIIGTYLVIDRQITIGQFVASEIIVVLVVGAVEKILLGIDTIFDLLTAVDKLGVVTDLPLESQKSVVNSLPKVNRGVTLRVDNLSYKYEDDNRPILQNIAFEAKANEKICVVGGNGSGKETLVNLLAGIYQLQSGRIVIDGIPIQDMASRQLHELVERNVATDGIFDGTVLENVSMKRSGIMVEDVYTVLDQMRLMDTISELPHGLSTPMVSGGRRFSNSFTAKITIARCMVSKPRLLLLSNCYEYFDADFTRHLLEIITSNEQQWTLITVSNNPLVMKACDRILLLDSGKLVANGSYEEVSEHPFFKATSI